MSQELKSAKYFQQPSQEEMKAYRKRAAGSSNGRLAAKSLFYLVLWVAILGGGGYMVCNAVLKARQEKHGAGTGAGPAMSVLSFCMHLVDLNWDEKVEREIERSWPEETPAPDMHKMANGLESLDTEDLLTELPEPSDYLPADLLDDLPRQPPGEP